MDPNLRLYEFPANLSAFSLLSFLPLHAAFMQYEFSRGQFRQIHKQYFSSTFGHTYAGHLWPLLRYARFFQSLICCILSIRRLFLGRSSKSQTSSMSSSARTEPFYVDNESRLLPPWLIQTAACCFSGWHHAFHHWA